MLGRSIMWRSRSRTPRRPLKSMARRSGPVCPRRCLCRSMASLPCSSSFPTPRSNSSSRSAEASPIAEFLERNADGGIHHVCYEVADIIAAAKADQGRRAGPRRRKAQDRRPRQAGAIPSPEGFFRRARRNRTGLSWHGLHHFDRVCDLLRNLVDRAVPDAAVRRAQQHEDGEGAGQAIPGTDPGAPVASRMGRKLIWTTII